VEYWAERIVPVTSDVKFSWNGALPETQERIMVGSRWEKSLHNLQHFIEVRNTHAEKGGDYCRVTLQLTFMESNLAELPDIVRLASQLGVDRVKGHHLWTHFPEIKALSLRRNKDSISRWNRAVEQMREVAKANPLLNGKRVLLENIHLLAPNATDDLAPGGECPFLGREAWIDTTGRFSPCCAPDAQRRTLGEFGNSNDVGLTTIWQGSAYRSLLGNYQDHPLCRACNMRKPREDE
jgi:MoaA/NifB/PqqE/SkfB family radical SAM enzyme